LVEKKIEGDDKSSQRGELDGSGFSQGLVDQVNVFFGHQDPWSAN